MVQKFIKTEKTFEQGGNNETIEFDDRMLNDDTFHQLSKLRNEALIENDDAKLERLNINDFTHEKIRLNVTPVVREDLFSTSSNQMQLNKIESAGRKNGVKVSDKFRTTFDIATGGDDLKPPSADKRGQTPLQNAVPLNITEEMAKVKGNNFFKEPENE